MIYYFKIVSQESLHFRLEVALDAKNTFFDFHSIIQKSVGFESHQLASFFVSDKRWKKLVEISIRITSYNVCYTKLLRRV